MGLFSKDTKTEITTQEPISGLPPHTVNSNSTITDPITTNDDSLIAEFISRTPGNTYLIDSSNDKNESLLCRQKPEGGQTCLKVKYDYIQLFKTMQKFDYFCALPVHKVEAQYFECKKI